MKALNKAISEDRDLGHGFRVGHSHAAGHGPVADWQQWWLDVLHGEIAPLLREMWFDRRPRADEHINKLEMLAKSAE